MAIAAIVFATTAAVVAAAMMVGDSGTGGISSSRITAGGSKNIMNDVAAIAITAAKIMSDGSVAASGNSVRL